MDLVERAKIEKALEFASQRQQEPSGVEPLETLVDLLAKSLGVAYAFVGKLVDSDVVETIALHAHGEIASNITYSLCYTPCEDVVGKRLCSHEREVQQRFPRDELLVEMGAESYVGVPLWNARGEPLGLIAILDTKPLESSDLASVFLRIVALRAGGELERRVAKEVLDQERQFSETVLESLRQSEERYRVVFNALSEAIFLHDLTTNNILQVNQTMLDMYGYDSSEEVLGLSIEELSEGVPPYTQQDADRIAKRAIEEGPQLFEWRSRRKDGSLFWTEVALRTAEVDGQGRVLAIARDITERKRAAEALFETKERIRSIVETSQDWIWAIDARGRHSYSNAAVQAILGYSPEEIVGVSNLERIHPEDMARVQALLPESVRTRSGWDNLVVRWRHKDGSWRFLESNAVPIVDAHGGLAGLRGVDRDITERKRAEDRLQAHAQRLALHAEYSPLGLIEWGADFRVAEWNRAAERLFGYSREEALGCHALDLIIPQSARAHVDAIWAALLSGTGGTRSTNENRTKSGEIVLCDWYNTTLVDTDGTVIGVASLVQDVTDRMRTAEERARLATIVEQGSESVIETDTEGTIQYVNPAFVKLTGYSSEEIVGRPASTLKSGQHTDAFYRELWETINGGEVWSGRFVNRKKDGTLFREDATISPVRDASGQTTHFVSVRRDVTHEAELEHQLQQSQKMEAVGQLAGGVAHDFNNLLTIINSYTMLAMDQLREADPLHQDLQEVKKAAGQAAELTNQLLAFSRKQTLQPAVLNINDLIGDLDKMLRRLIGEDVVVSTMLADDLEDCLVDASQIEQVIMNLVVNARDAMPDGGRLTIETANFEIDEEYASVHVGVAPGPYVLITVTDSGRGMAEATRSQIFEPFFTTKEKGKGTGLGLSTVYGIVRQSRGNVWVYSEPGIGTTFKVFLPVSDDGEPALPRMESTDMAAHGDETILLVEDNEQVRRMASRILKSAGYSVIAAANGGEALLACERGPEDIDLLVTDVIMPGMNGRELQERLSQLRPGLRVLYMSGYTDAVIARHGVLDWGVRFVGKPFNPKALTVAVRNALDDRP